jgi:hypothetical protein
MNRKLTAAAVLVAAISVLAASCTLPAPASRNWKVKPVSIEVVEKEDFDPGDEPYVIQLGFRSKLGVENSSQVSVRSGCRANQLPATDVGTNGTVVPVPPGGSDIEFPGAQNLDIGDILLETAPFEIFGTLSFVMERDGLFAGACAVTDLIQNVLSGVLKDSLNVLIAGSDVPPTEEELIDLIVSNLGDFLSAIPGLIAATIEGLGDPDDILGVAVQIHLPTAGAFTSLLDLGLTLAGLDNGVLEIDELPPTVAFRVGKLLPSSASFTFSGPGYEHIFTSSVGM